MAPNFIFYRVICITPPDLEEERLAFESAVSRFVETVSMPDGVLFAPASLRPPTVAARQKAAIEANIRMCEFTLAVFGEQAPDPVFEEFAAYALACAADPDLATRSLAVCFRNAAGASREICAQREKLAREAKVAVHDFRSVEEFGRLVETILAGWYARTREGHAPVAVE